MSLVGRSFSSAFSLLRKPGILNNTLVARNFLNTSCVYFQSGTTAASGDVNKSIDKMVKNNKIVVFMKGVPEQPKCGFSNAVVQILRMHGVNSYDSHDVLADESIRQGVKDFSNWPTIPQVYINGEFVGGCDIMIQMHQNGDLIEVLDKAGIKSALVDAETPDKKKE